MDPKAFQSSSLAKEHLLVEDLENRHLKHLEEDGHQQEGRVELHLENNENAESKSNVYNLDENIMPGTSQDPRLEKEECSHQAEWTKVLSEIHIKPFTGESGPCHSLPGSATVLDFFHLLWPEQLFEMIVLETNRSAEQRAVVLGKMDPLWSPVNVPELKAFFSIVVMMGIKSLPRIWCYWSGNRALRCEWVSSIMSYTRFAKIRQYLQASNGSCVTERSDPTYDPIYKVRAIVDKLQTNFSQYYRPRRELSVDEGMIPFKGRLFFKQHMPNKPAKWGIKVWELCEAQTGYCLSFDIYTGRRRDGGTEHGLGYKVVMHLSKPYWHKGHHLYFDRYFSSPHLLEDLENRCGTYGCSTVSLHRTGLPLAARTSSLQARGDVEFFQKRNLVLTLWRDRRLVSMLSTNIDPRVDIGGNGTTRPLSVLQYNQFMGGVDRSDQYRSYYTVGRTSKKWWCYILWFLVNLSIVNAWLLFRESCHDYTSSKNYDHFQFRVDLAEQLRAGWAKRGQHIGRRSRLSVSYVSAENMAAHCLIKMPRGKKACRLCSKRGLKTMSGNQVKSSFGCGVCDVHLCRFGCFRDFHHLRS